MKKLIIILSVLMACNLQAQDTVRFWHNISFQAEFCHTEVRCYDFGPGFLRNRPDNSVTLGASYDFGRIWTVGIFVGYSDCRLGGESYTAQMYTPVGGTSSRKLLEDTPMFSLGLESTIHPLALITNASSPYDLTLNARVAKNPRDLDYGVGLGLSYKFSQHFSLYGRAYYGSFLFPIGMQEDYNGFFYHFHTVAGLAYHL